jgi:hypothetical protein
MKNRIILILIFLLLAFSALFYLEKNVMCWKHPAAKKLLADYFLAGPLKQGQFLDALGDEKAACATPLFKSVLQNVGQGYSAIHAITTTNNHLNAALALAKTKNNWVYEYLINGIENSTSQSCQFSADGLAEFKSPESFKVLMEFIQKPKNLSLVAEQVLKANPHANAHRFYCFNSVANALSNYSDKTVDEVFMRIILSKSQKNYRALLISKIFKYRTPEAFKHLFEKRTQLEDEELIKQILDFDTRRSN